MREMKTEKRQGPHARKIIFLEDEDVLARLYTRKLEEAGYDVKLCRSTNELIRELKTFMPDLAFLDHALHGDNKSGLEMIPVLKKHNDGMKIVMLTNYSKFQMEQETRKAGAIDYLVKLNTSPSELVQYVKALLK